MKRILAVVLLFWCCGSVAMAAPAIYESEGAMESAVIQAVDARLSEVHLPISYSDSQVQSDPAERALGLYGERKYGKNTILKGVDSFQRFHTIEDGVIHYKYRIKYNYTKEEEALLQQSILSWVDSNLTQDMSETVKTAIIAKYISENYRFTTSRDYDHAVAAFRYKSADPTGIAELASRMFSAAGIQNDIITGVTVGPTLRWSPDKPVTLDSLRLYRTPAETVATPDLQAWNLIRIDGSWYHVNFYRYGTNPQGQGISNTGELLTSDSIFGLTDGWIRSEYPKSEKTLWEVSGPDQAYLKAVFHTVLFDYPVARTTDDYVEIVRDAMRKGKSHVEVRTVTEPGSPGECTPLSSTDGTVGLVRFGNQMKTNGYYAQYFHVELNPYEPESVYEVDKLPNTLFVERGDILDLEKLTRGSASAVSSLAWKVLSPGKFRLKDGKYQAASTGMGYISAISGNNQKTLRIEVVEPKLGIILDGKALDTGAPVIRDGRTLVPLRSLFEAIGAAVDYDSATRTVFAQKADRSVQFVIGESVALVSGEKTPMGTSAEIIDGRCYVPVRFVGESLGVNVEWDSLRNKVIVSLDSTQDQGQDN